MPDNGMVAGVTPNVVTSDAKRHAVTHLCEAHGVSERRACHVLRVDLSTVRYTSRRGDDADLRAAIEHVPRELVRIMSDRGLPGTIVSGNGAEFTGTAILHRVRNAGIDWRDIAPGKLRDECLNDPLFSSLAEARKTLQNRRRDCNRHRPHSALGHPTLTGIRRKKSMDTLAAQADQIKP